MQQFARGQAGDCVIVGQRHGPLADLRRAGTHHAEHTADLAPGVEQRALDDLDVQRATVPGAQLLLHHTGLGALHDLLVRGDHLARRAVVKQRLVVMPDDGLARHADDAGDGLVGDQVAPVAVLDEDRVLAVGHHRFDQAALQRLLAQRAPQHVADQADRDTADDQHGPVEQLVAGIDGQAVERLERQVIDAHRHHGGGNQPRPQAAEHGTEQDRGHEQVHHGLPFRFLQEVVTQQQHRRRHRQRKHRGHPLGPAGRRATEGQRVDEGSLRGLRPLLVGRHGLQGQKEPADGTEHEENAEAGDKRQQMVRIYVACKQFAGEKGPQHCKHHINRNRQQNKAIAGSCSHHPCPPVKSSPVAPKYHKNATANMALSAA